MAEISAALVKELRETTGAGMMDCKKALSETNGDMNAAIEVLRKKGLKDVNKRAGKVAAEGAIGVYTHPGDQVVALVELNCETDFVAKGEDFKQLARMIAMQVAAMKPSYVSIEEIPTAVIEKEKEILMEQLPADKRAQADKIIPGKLKNFYEGSVLLEQGFIKDDSGKKTIKDIVTEYSIKCGEKVQVRRFLRMEVGEGVEKVAGNFADEVMATVGAQL